MSVTPGQVRKQFNEQKNASSPKEEQYQRFLRRSGQTEADLLERVELDALSYEIREHVSRDDVEVTDAEIQRYYDENRERFTLPERRDVLVVLTKTRTESEAARARIEGGERWASVAKDLSIDPSTRSRGGRLRNVAEGQQERRLDRALFAADRGELGGPVETRFGFYVFKVTRVRPAARQTLARARDTIRQLLRSMEEQQSFDRFVRSFTKRWRARTICSPGYRTTDCANGRRRRLVR